METLRQILEQADVRKVAVGHFNVSDLVTLKAVFESARERIRAIRAETRVFMTLHGASGTDDNDLLKAIAAGMTVVHINTEVRLAWRHGLNTAVAGQPNEIVPYKLLPRVVDSVKQVVTARLGLFGGGKRSHLASA